ACSCCLAGIYRTVNAGTGGTFNRQASITQVEPLTYRISDTTGGLYAVKYGGEANPAIITDLSNDLPGFAQSVVVFGSNRFNGTGRVNANGTITISWSNESDESGVTTLTTID